MKTLRILCAAPGPTDATSYYRALGPMTVMRKQFEDIEITMGGQNSSDYDWPQLRFHDVLYFQRPSIPAHASIISRAAQSGVPVVIDFDDELTAVPKGNSTYPMYSNPANQAAIMTCLKLATHVMVSTEHLKEKLSQFTDANKITVVPNALDNYALKQRADLPAMKDRRKIVLWRGSSTHVEDLLEYKNEILYCAKENPDWHWLFIGLEPWFLAKEMKEGTYSHGPWTTHEDYFRTIKNVAAPIQIVPLSDNSFNRSKSNIAWIEGSLAGSAVLCPHWQAWNYPGALMYEDKEHFCTILMNAMLGQIPLDACANISWQSIQQDLLLTDTNKIRYEIFKNVAIEK